MRSGFCNDMADGTVWSRRSGKGIDFSAASCIKRFVEALGKDDLSGYLPDGLNQLRLLSLRFIVAG
jgi:hypothetical protein